MMADQIFARIWSLGHPGAADVRDHVLERYTLPPTGGWRQTADHTGDAALNVGDIISAINSGYE
jgi:hypothetical protein